MSPFSGTVIGAATVVASPALWLSMVDGTLPFDVALGRFVVALVASWVAISLVVEFALPAPGTTPAADPETPGSNPSPALESAE